MLKGRGKGKVPHDLVAASCAAVLAIYAAGYSRTRDAAKRFETQTRERRAAARVDGVPAVSPKPDPVTRLAMEPAPAALPQRETPPEHKVSHARHAASRATAAAKKSGAQPPEPVAATQSSAPGGVPSIAPVPLPPPETTAPGPIAIAREAATAPAVKWRDGTFTGVGNSAHGDIQARVVIKDGRIVEAGIALCDTRYPCDVIDPLIHQPVERQSAAIDYMSHATESSDAYYDGLVEALDNARETPAAEPTFPQVIRAEAVMGTRVSIEVDAPDAVVARAFGWFHHVEEHCSRFDAASELRQLRVGERTCVSPIFFEAVRFALMVAEETDGAFDPTVGGRMVARGFNRHYLTRQTSGVAGCEDAVSFRDVEIDVNDRTILLRRALTLDLGAVAKGLAVDAAARELQSYRNFAIDAGGDLYLGGRNPRGEPWSAGIRHPRDSGGVLERLRLSDRAVCTSGDYERGPHILDPRGGGVAQGVVSATVVAPSAMLADALATAAFVLAPQESIALLARMGVEGLIVTSDLELVRTPGLRDA